MTTPDGYSSRVRGFTPDRDATREWATVNLEQRMTAFRRALIRAMTKQPVTAVSAQPVAPADGERGERESEAA